MSSFIEINNKPATKQQPVVQKQMFLNQNHINQPQSAFSNILPNSHQVLNNNIFNNVNQFINTPASPSEFQPPLSKHGQFSRPNNNISNNNHLFNHHLNQLPNINSISSPICNPSTGLNGITISNNQPFSNLSQQFQQQAQMACLDSAVNRPAFRNSNADRKPEELDALANELLSEFSIKKIEINTNQAAASAAVASVSLSPLSSSSSSSSSTARSSSSSSSSSTESDNNANELLIQQDNFNNEESASNNSNSITNKSGTLVIHRDNNSSSIFSDKIKNLRIDNLPDLLLTQQQSNIPNVSNISSQLTQSDLINPPSAMPHSFVSYNPKSIINPIGVSGSLNSFDSGIPSTPLSGSLSGSGVGSVIQPLNESQLRKGNQVI